MPTQAARRRLHRALVLALLAAAPVAAAGQPAPEPAGEALERAIVEGVNEARREHDLKPLATDAELARVAREYSCEMAKREFFQHTTPSGTTMGDRLEQAGIRYRVAGENLARIEAENPAERAVAGWLESPGHRENMLGARFTKTGVGACRAGRAVYFTQLFLRPR